jgi:hypothetical protein
VSFGLISAAQPTEFLLAVPERSNQRQKRVKILPDFVGLNRVHLECGPSQLSFPLGTVGQLGANPSDSGSVPKKPMRGSCARNGEGDAQNATKHRIEPSFCWEANKAGGTLRYTFCLLGYAFCGPEMIHVCALRCTVATVETSAECGGKEKGVSMCFRKE